MDRLTERFLQQNPLSAETLTAEQIEDYTAEHSGGLVVLLGYVGPNLLVKMHDSWGGDDSIVVHQYDPDAEDPRFSEVERVWDFTNANEAFDLFIAFAEGN